MQKGKLNNTLDYWDNYKGITRKLKRTIIMLRNVIKALFNYVYVSQMR